MIVGSIVRNVDVAQIAFTLVDYRTHPSRSWTLVRTTVDILPNATARAALRDALRAALLELGDD